MAGRARSTAVRPPEHVEPALDDEPLTAADLRAIRQAEEEIRRGEFVTVEELKAHVARRRSKVRPAKP